MGLHPVCSCEKLLFGCEISFLKVLEGSGGLSKYTYNPNNAYTNLLIRSPDLKH